MCHVICIARNGDEERGNTRDLSGNGVAFVGTTSKGANGIGCEVVLTHGEKGVGGGNGDFYILAFCSFLALSSVREKPLL